MDNASLAILLKHLGRALINAGEELQGAKPKAMPSAQPQREEPPAQRIVKPKLNTVKDTGVCARFSAADNVDKLKSLAPNNSPEQVAALLGFTPKQVKCYTSLLRKKAGIDIPRFKTTGRGYSTKSQRIDEIIKAHIDTLTYREIATKVLLELNETVSEKAIAARVDTLGLSAKRNKEWEAEREQIIRSNHGKLTVAELAEMVKMSVSGLEKIISKLGLSKYPHKAKPSIKKQPVVKPVKQTKPKKADTLPDYLKDPEPIPGNATKWHEGTIVTMPKGKQVKALLHTLVRGNAFYGPPINHPDFAQWLLKKVTYLERISIKPEQLNEQYYNEYKKLKK